METLKHIVWTVSLLVMTSIVSLSFATKEMMDYPLWITIVGIIVLFIIACMQYDLLKRLNEQKEKALDNELKRKQDWAEFEKSLYPKYEKSQKEKLEEIDDEYEIKFKKQTKENELKELQKEPPTSKAGTKKEKAS